MPFLQTSLPALGLRQFRAEGCTSYLVHDRASRQAAIIDPVLDLLDAYRVQVSEQGLSVRYALETHSHSDHASATHAVRAEFGAQVGAVASRGNARPDLELWDGQKLPLGQSSLEVLATPGHTADSVCFRLGNLLFTGDTLLVGGTGRWDAPDGDPALLWNSLDQRLAPLEPGLVVLPAHGCSGHLFSLLGVERKRNLDWLSGSAQELLERKRSEFRDPPPESVLRHLAFNHERDPDGSRRERTLGGAWVCAAASPEADPFTVLGVDKFKKALARRDPAALFIDVREASEFEALRIAGSVQVPLSELGLRVSELRAAPRIFVVCQSGRRSQNAAQTLTYVGHPDVVQLKGGIQAWQQAGYEVETSS